MRNTLVTNTRPMSANLLETYTDSHVISKKSYNLRHKMTLALSLPSLQQGTSDTAFHQDCS